jgi:lipoprotein-releasing system permease protein
MGATNRQILRIFMLNGLMIGLMGTAIGVVCGTGLCAALEKYKFIKVPSEVYHTDSLPILMSTEDVVVIALSAIVICFLAAVYPARQAAKVNPTEALRAG